MKTYQILLTLSLLSQALIAEPGPIKPPFVKPPVVAPTPVTTRTYHLAASDLSREVDRLLLTAKMKLNNHQSQSSFVELQGVRLGFQIQRAVVDIDCGTFCPDLGDGYFYINDINLSRADLILQPSSYQLALAFEGSGREIKGYHSVLGDNGMPDFQMDNAVLRVTAMPYASNGQMSLGFTNAKLVANITSTGGCHLGGIDVCDKIFKTDRRIQKAVESASQSALNGGLIQSAMRIAMRNYLQTKGITGSVLSARLVGNDLQVTVQQ